MKKRRYFRPVGAAAALLLALAGARPAAAVTCGNGQTVVTTKAVAALPNISYEVDYATSSGGVSGTQTPAFANTIVTIGLPRKAASTSCEVQVEWFDWNGAPFGISGPPQVIAPGFSYEFTSSNNVGVPLEYPPYCENVFRSLTKPFEGYAQILTDANCPAGTRFRVDAEWVTATPMVAPSGQTTYAYFYKPINVSQPTGVIGY